MRPFLTLHHPAAAARYYEQGLWCSETFYTLAARHAQGRPDAIAVQDGRRALSWRELVHWVDGVFRRVLMPRVLKFDPACVDNPICAPLNPPRETSHGDVPSVARVVASRGMSLPPKPSPLSVVLF